MRNYYQVNKDKIDTNRKKNYQKNKQKINIRRRKYEESNKDKVKEWSRNYRKKHRKEIIKRKKEYRLKNIDKIKQHKKEFYQANRDKINKTKKKWYESNKDKIKNYISKRYQEDNNFRIIRLLRGGLQRAFKNYTKIGKIKSSEEYEINFELIIEQLKPFPSDLLDYHIDHIKPLCSFNFINLDGSTNLREIQKAFAPENHQWLLAIDNLKKGGRINNEIQNSN